MSKPCYTCTDKFISNKMMVLLENKRQEAKEYAKKNNYTGAIAILRLGDSDGFKFVEAGQNTTNQQATEYLLFDKGLSF